jgi:hypothetical protein
MPYDEATLGQALINADKAGDVDAARALAGEIQKMRGATVDTPQPAQPPQSAEPQSGFVRGLKDAPEGMTQLIGKIVEAVAPKDSWIGQGAKKTNDALTGMFRENESQYQAGRGKDAGIDWSRIGGNVAMTAPIGAGFGAGATLPRAIASGLASGAFSGAAEPVLSDDFWADKAKQIATGMGVGGVSAGAAHAIGRVLSPQTDELVKALMDKGVTPTPGQILGGAAKTAEEKMTSLPVFGDAIVGAQRRSIGDLNKAVYEDVLKPIGESAPSSIGRDAIKTVGNKISDAYDNVLSQVSFLPDQKFSQDISNILQTGQGLPQREADALRDIVKEKVVKQIGPQGPINGNAFKEIESSVGGEAARFSKSSDAFQQKLGDALSSVVEALRDGLARTNQGVKVNVNGTAVDAADRLQNLNESWARLVRLERAGGSAGATDGVFTPSQLSSAVKGADNSVRKRAFSRGDALMQDLSDAGRGVLGDKYPDSGTAGRLLPMLLGGGIATLAPAAVDHPIATALAATALGAAAAPYTKTGQKLAAALLAGERPAVAKVVGDTLKSGAPYAAAASPSIYGYGR